MSDLVEKTYWPQTLVEFDFQVPANELDVRYPPFHKARYKSEATAKAVCLAANEPLVYSRATENE